MPLYTCPRCHYTFPSVEKPGACPDCGHKRIVPATDFEFNRFYAEKLDLMRTAKADGMSVDERNWSRVLLLLNVPNTNPRLKEDILPGLFRPACGLLQSTMRCIASFRSPLAERKIPR